MTSILASASSTLSNPLDTVEGVALERDWAFDRLSSDELVAEIAGGWCNYRLWFTWVSGMGSLMTTCTFESKVPAAHREKIYPLLSMTNERMWLGHFDLSSDDGSLSYRHGILVREAMLSTHYIEDLLDIAIAECERFYPAFQSVVWGGKTCHEALEAAVFETVGEA